VTTGFAAVVMPARLLHAPTRWPPVTFRPGELDSPSRRLLQVSLSRRGTYGKDRHVKPRRTSAAALTAVLMVLVTSCAKSDDGAPPAAVASSPSTSAAATPAASATPTPSAPSPPSITPTAPASPADEDDGADVTVRIALAGGRPTERPEPVVEIEQGQIFELIVSSDEAHEIHVHGYDESFEIPAGGEGSATFEADQTGVWEVEIEDTGSKLFDLRVQ
jgi:hypothetical protein